MAGRAVTYHHPTDRHNGFAHFSIDWWGRLSFQPPSIKGNKMKRLSRFILYVILGLFLVCPSFSLAAGTVTATDTRRISVSGTIQRTVVTLTCTADASAATFPSFTLNPATYGITGWYLYSVETNPGTTAPTDDYDIAITDADGFDVAGGLLANRDTANTEKVYLGSVGYPVIDGSWTLAITGNSINSAVIVIRLTFTAN